VTVRCPRCDTLFRRPARADHGTFRCARCRHVFEAAADEPAFVARADDDAADAADDDDEPFVLDDEPAGAVAPPPRAARRRAAEPPDADEEETPPVTSAARFAVRALVLVTLVYALLSAWLLAEPGRARESFRRVPLIGTRLAESRVPPAAVQLAHVTGQYQRIRGDHLVFVVSGTAVNASPVPVRGIQVQAFLEGAETQRQTVFCGAGPRDVRDLSLREIALLQTIEPPHDWALPPGDEAAFAVVFTDPPAAPRDFGAEVVAVRAPRRG
jgi:endogenous inhibitor of DNA gyrase (YacG/DUF329 family)